MKEWSKATVRRQKSLVKMLKPKTRDQIEAEYKLANETPDMHFYMSTFKGPVTKENELPGSAE